MLLLILLLIFSNVLSLSGNPVQLVPVEIQELNEGDEQCYEAISQIESLDKFLDEQFIVSGGIYFFADSVWNIRRMAPLIPFSISVGNAQKNKKIIKEIRVLGPDKKVLKSFKLQEQLSPAKEDFEEKKVSLENKINQANKNLKEIIDSNEADIDKKIKCEKIMKEIYLSNSQSLLSVAESSSPLVGGSANLDLTSYLKKVGDKVTITVQAKIKKWFIFTKTAETKYTYNLKSPLPDPTG